MDQGDSVRILDNFLSGKRENLADMADRVELLEGDILDDDALTKAMRGVEVVFHQAAIPSVPRSMAAPIASHDTNATGTLRVLEKARQSGVRRVVYAASSSAYGDAPTMPKVETMRPLPLSPYAAAKLAGEQYCQAYARAYGLETVCLRYFNVFGPRQDPFSEYAAVIPRFITWGMAGKTLTIHGDGTQSRDFCFIDNTVEANLKAATAPAGDVSGRVFNVACGAATSLNDVVVQIGEILGRRLDVHHGPSRAGDVKHSLADISLARQHLGYSAAISFAEGLRRTARWYLNGKS